MSTSKEDILNAVADMSVMDVCDLVKMMEEKLINSRKSLSNLGSMLTPAKDFEATNSTIQAKKGKKAAKSPEIYYKPV